MQRQVLVNQKPHWFPLPEKQKVSESKLNQRLEVESDQHQTKDHAQQNEEENVQYQSKVAKQKSQGKKVIDSCTVKYTDKPESQVGV